MGPLPIRNKDGSFTRAGCLWIVTAVIGVVLAGLSVVALFDPEGTKLADDTDPFGTPPSRTSSLIWLGVATLLVTWPLIVTRTQAPRSESDSRRAGSG